MNNNKRTSAILVRRKQLAIRLSGLQLQQLEILVNLEQNQEKKEDLAWILERRRRRVRMYVRQLEISAETLDSSSLPVAAGTVVGFKLFIDAIGAASTSPLYIIGSIFAAVVWAGLKLKAASLKSKAEGLRSGIGE
jgi:hypothetical protein